MKLPRLRWKGRAAYFDHGGTPRRWEALGNDPATVKARYDVLMAAHKALPNTIDAMLADCIAAMRGKVAAGTLANYRSYRKHLAVVFGHLPPDHEKMTQAAVLRYGKLCPRTSFRGELALLSMAYVRWMMDGRLDFNPCFGVRIRRKSSRRDRLLTNPEIDAIVAQADDRLALAIELAYATGLRIGDLCRLRWPDLAGGIQTSKTGARLHFEPSPALDAILERGRALQARVASLYVLCDRRGRPWKPDTLRTRWNAACQAAGIADAHFHDLRAAGATETERQGGDPQRFLGHRHRQTTEVYLRDRRANVVRALARKTSTGGG